MEGREPVVEEEDTAWAEVPDDPWANPGTAIPADGT